MQILIYNLLRSFLSQEARNKLKKLLYAFRRKFDFIFLYVFGTTDDDNLFKQILNEIGSDFDILMIHSSYDNMIPMYKGNIHSLVTKFIEFSNSNNITIAMPAFFLGKGGGNDMQSAALYYEKHPIFNINSTYSQMGLFSEIFRRYPGVFRSIHPTHSISAYGPLAEKITSTHHLANNPYGEMTPFGYMAQFNTKILGIGTKYYRVLTQAHTAEEILKDDFPIKFTYDKKIPVTCKLHNGTSIVYQFLVRRKEYRIDALALKKILKNIKIKTWRYKGIPFFLTDAKSVTDELIKAAKRGKTIYKKIS